MSVMCRLYGVTRAGYYAWKGRGESARAKADGRLWVHIERIYQASGGTYGSPRIHAALKAQGSGVGKKRIERSMRKHGLRARSAKLYHANPGSHAFFASIPNRQLDIIADRAGLGGRYYVSQGRGAVAVSGNCHRQVFASGHRLESRPKQRCGSDARIAQSSGIPSTPWSRRDLSHRPRDRVCWLCVPRPTDTARFCTEHEPPRGVDRQRAYGVIFSLHEVRCRSRRCF